MKIFTISLILWIGLIYYGNADQNCECDQMGINKNVCIKGCGMRASDIDCSKECSNMYGSIDKRYACMKGCQQPLPMAKIMPAATKGIDMSPFFQSINEMVKSLMSYDPFKSNAKTSSVPKKGHNHATHVEKKEEIEGDKGDLGLLPANIHSSNLNGNLFNAFDETERSIFDDLLGGGSHDSNLEGTNNVSNLDDLKHSSRFHIIKFNPFGWINSLPSLFGNEIGSADEDKTPTLLGADSVDTKVLTNGHYETVQQQNDGLVDKKTSKPKHFFVRISYLFKPTTIKRMNETTNDSLESHKALGPQLPDLYHLLFGNGGKESKKAPSAGAIADNKAADNHHHSASIQEIELPASTDNSKQPDAPKAAPKRQAWTGSAQMTPRERDQFYREIDALEGKFVHEPLAAADDKTGSMSGNMLKKADDDGDVFFGNSNAMQKFMRAIQDIPNSVILGACVLLFMLVFGYLSFNLIFHGKYKKSDKMHKLLINEECNYYQPPVLVTCPDDLTHLSKKAQEAAASAQVKAPGEEDRMVI